MVTELARLIKTNKPEIKGFSDKNSWRMKQFYETYKDYPKLAPLVREISWTFQTAGKTACYSKKESFRIKIRSFRIKSYHLGSLDFETWKSGKQKKVTRANLNPHSKRKMWRIIQV